MARNLNNVNNYFCPPMNPFVIPQLTITDTAEEGRGLARHEGLVVFVQDAIPGDVVDVEVYRKKKNFMEARAILRHVDSPDRTEPFCSHFGLCGGCRWQSMKYEAQLQHKSAAVTEALKRIAKVPLPESMPILGSPATTAYRNKLEFTFSNKTWLTKEQMDAGLNREMNVLGYHIPKRFDKVFALDKCYLQEDISNEMRDFVRDFTLAHGYTYFDLREQTGLMRNLIIRTATTGDCMLIVVFANNDSEKIDQLMKALSEKFPTLTSLQYVINTKGNSSITDLQPLLYAGLPYITETMKGAGKNGGTLNFKIGARSFYQVNPVQAERLYNLVADFANLQGDELVFDLYTGTGTIAAFLAHACRSIVGIEYVEEAVVAARENASANAIENATFYAGDMKDVFNEQMMAEHGMPQVVITDPPRAGMHEDVCRTLLTAAPEKIIYVSCNPATQARDIAILGEKYEVAKYCPVDMFPHTQHVENIALLQLKK